MAVPHCLPNVNEKSHAEAPVFSTSINHFSSFLLWIHEACCAIRPVLELPAAQQLIKKLEKVDGLELVCDGCPNQK